MSGVMFGVRDEIMDDSSSNIGDAFDQAIRKLTGLPDTVSTRPTTVTIQTPFGLLTQDWIIQTFRRTERDDDGRSVKSSDIAFVRYMDSSGSRRFIIPDEVLTTIMRQRDALGTKNKKRAARETMRRRKAAGEDLGAALRKPAAQKAARAARKAKAAKKAARRVRS